MARNMIIKYGMAEHLGPMYHERSELETLSPATREAVEAEVKTFVTRAEANARRILGQHKDELHKLAKGLLEHETISRAEIGELLAGRPIRETSGPRQKAGGEKSKGKDTGSVKGSGGVLPATHSTQQDATREDAAAR